MQATPTALVVELLLKMTDIEKSGFTEDSDTGRSTGLHVSSVGAQGAGPRWGRGSALGVLVEGGRDSHQALCAGRVLRPTEPASRDTDLSGRLHFQERALGCLRKTFPG